MNKCFFFFFLHYFSFIVTMNMYSFFFKRLISNCAFSFHFTAIVLLTSFLSFILHVVVIVVSDVGGTCTLYCEIAATFAFTTTAAVARVAKAIVLPQYSFCLIWNGKMEMDGLHHRRKLAWRKLQFSLSDYYYHFFCMPCTHFYFFKVVFAVAVALHFLSFFITHIRIWGHLALWCTLYKHTEYFDCNLVTSRQKHTNWLECCRWHCSFVITACHTYFFL